MKYENAKIVEAGLYYIGHFRTAHIMLDLETRGGGASITIPVDRVEELVDMFENDIRENVEDGFYIEHLKGVPMKLLLDATGKIVAFGDIFSEEDEMMKL
jgi:hypothetical protein